MTKNLAPRAAPCVKDTMAIPLERYVLLLMVLLGLGKVHANTEIPVTLDADAGRYLRLRSDQTSNGVKTIVAAKGDIVELQCEFRVSGWSKVQWLQLHEENHAGSKKAVELPQELISRNDSTSTAILKNVTADHERNYSCVLSSLLSDSNTYTFRVFVKDALSCRENSCSSNGNCSETTDGHICECEDRFVGENCEFRNPCFISPCLNGGICTADDEEYSCSCPSGFAGNICQNEVCTLNICGSGGTCSDTDGKISCTCPYNRAGNRCQYRCRMNSGYSYCGSDPVTCKYSVFSGVDNCVCDRRRRSPSGTRCMLRSDERNECVQPNICSGRGSCANYVFGFKCNCNRYAFGTNCEFYNECRRSDNLCLTFGGTCLDLTDGYMCRNCPNGQYGNKCLYKKDPCKVTCHGSSMIADCDERFLTKKLKLIPIYLNSNTESCRLPRASGWLRRLTVSYTNCGTETEYNKDHVVYRNYLRAGNITNMRDESSPIITRDAGHFLFKMECALPLVRNASTGLSDLSLQLNETLDLEDHKNINVAGTNIKFYKVGYSSRISNYLVGDRLYVMMTINANSDPSLSAGYELHPVTCFATPSSSADGERYMILENGCILDDTFRFERKSSRYLRDRRVSYFSFDSFSFKSNPGKLYLHCSSLACINEMSRSHNSEERCGVLCENGETSTESPTTITSPGLQTSQPQNATITRAPGSSVEIFSG